MSDEALLIECVSADLDALVSMQGQSLDEIIGKEALEGFSILGVDPIYLLELLLDGFSYDVLSTSIDGDSGIVTLSVSCKSMAEIQSEFDSQIAALANEAASDVEILASAGSILLDVVQSAPMLQQEIQLTAHKIDGQWVADAENMDIGSKLFSL